MHCREPMIRRSVLGFAVLSLSSMLGSIAACSTETIINSAPAAEEISVRGMSGWRRGASREPTSIKSVRCPRARINPAT